MNNQLNNFFDTATPAEINQMPIEPSAEQPTIEAVNPSETMQDLPALELEQQEQPAIQEQPKQQAATIVDEFKETPIQKNWREIREAKLRAEWERDQLAREISALKMQRQKPTITEEDDDLNINPDAIIEGKDLQKIIKQERQRAERNYQRQLQQQQQQTVKQLNDYRIRQEMPDIDAVVNQNTVDILKTNYPEIADSISANPDEYSKLKSAYVVMKKLGIVQSTAQGYDHQQDKTRIQQNLAKPRPIQSVTQRQSPLANSGAYEGTLTDEMKAATWKEMRQYLK